MKIQDILKNCNVTQDNINKFSKLIEEGFVKYNINEEDSKISFLANALVESSNFSRLEENLNYSVNGLIATFPTRISKEQAQKLGYIKDSKGNVIQKANKEEIANLAYGNRYGNNAKEGYFFRGRGIYQLTFRQNYQAYKNFSGVDVVSNPDLLLQPKFAVDSAFWFYTSNKIDKLKDIKEIRKKINGGSNGLNEVVELYNKIKKMGLQ